MNRSSLRISWLLLFLIGSFSGCGWFGSDEAIPLEEDLPELSLSDPSPIELNSPDNEASEDATHEHQPSLNVGDRFPLVKTVIQTLSQPTPQGVQTSQTNLEMQLTITVEEIQDDRKRLSVWYQRVRYSQNISGKRIEFDSESPQNPVPLEARAYQGLVKNGFSFWTDANNHVFELSHFDDFLKQCLANIPPTERHKTFEKLMGNSGEGGMATFIDENIGLLPYRLGSHGENSIVKAGDSWKRDRRLTFPFPMHLSNKCTLKSLTDLEAQIDIVGDITPVRSMPPQASKNAPVSLQVRGGHTFGSCTIDRRTGLPLRSRVERHIDMIVQVSDGESFQQQKKIVTTIKSLPNADDSESPHAGAPNANPDANRQAAGRPMDRPFGSRRR